MSDPALPSPLEAVAALAVLGGAGFMLIASFGIWRLATFYQRIHASTKAATLGLALLLIALAVHLRDGSVATKALLALIFIGVTAPVGAHILTRAAYRLKAPAPEPGERDEYGGDAAAGLGGEGSALRDPSADADPRPPIPDPPIQR